ncbi:MAG: hypothetical protein ACPGQD_01775 [Planctomycetota bacterium]
MAPIAAQQSVGFGETAQLPTVATAGADHATIATNSHGDSFVAWHGTFSSGFHVVEGALITYEAGTFTSGQSTKWVLGDATLGIMGPNGDTCTKPDVIAMPDDTFIVAWQRSERGGSTNARIEACRVTVRDGNGDLLVTPILDVAQPGEGFVIDANIEKGDSGVMVDLVALDQDTVAAVYVHQASSSVDPISGYTYRDYDLRITRMDWDLGPGSPSFLFGPTTLQPNIPLDSTPTHPFNGGQVLPDVVLDDLGDLVVAYEQFRLDGHGGVPSSNEGHVVVRRFIGYGKPNELTQTNADFFTNFINRHQRRPNLAASRDDNVNSVSLTWMEDEVTFWRSNAIFGLELDYGPGTGPPTTRPLYWPNENGREDTLPAVVHGTDKLRFILGVRGFSSGDRLLLSRTKEADIFELSTAIKWPWRPAADLVENTNMAGVTNKLLFVTYEGSESGNPTDYRIYFQAYLLP